MQKMITLGKLLSIAAMLALTACGGGTGPAGTTATVSPASAAAAAATTTGRIQLLVSSPQMPSSGASTVTLTAIVTTSTGQAIQGKAVTFSNNNDPTATFGAQGTSDANGLVTTTLNLGSNHSNRTISLSATADAVTATNSVTVTGTTVSISGNNSLALNANTALTISVKDSAGVALQNTAVTVTSAKGNPVALAPATGLTDASGSITANVTGTVGGTDTITVSAAGASKTQSLTVSTASFAFTTPNPTTVTQINVNTATPLKTLWTNPGAVVGSAVTFTATRGTVTLSPALTDGTGTATASITSAAAGPAIITASGPGGTPSATINVNFVATSATTVTAQANPSTLQPTSGAAGQTNNVSTISAVVRDAAFNLVQNAQVNFAIVADNTGGSLSATQAVTDATGTASVTYKSGGQTSAQNGVTISAQPVNINGVAIIPAIAAQNVTLTVGGISLFVTLGTDNLVQSNPPNNSKIYSALVTDSAGNPVANTTVTFVLRPTQYMKGSYSWGGTTWLQNPSTTQPCLNEDINYNGFSNITTASAANMYGFLGPGNASIAGMGLTTSAGVPVTTNDFNGDGQLWPGNVASVNGTATTNASGFATATVTYPKDHAWWAQVTLQATAPVAGNAPPATATFYLPGLASDYTTQTVAPPGQTSPYGTANTCNNPR